MSDLIDLYQEIYQPSYNQRYGNPEIVDNINRGLLIRQLIEERKEDFKDIKYVN